MKYQNLSAVIVHLACFIGPSLHSSCALLSFPWLLLLSRRWRRWRRWRGGLGGGLAAEVVLLLLLLLLLLALLLQNVPTRWR